MLKFTDKKMLKVSVTSTIVQNCLKVTAIIFNIICGPFNSYISRTWEWSTVRFWTQCDQWWGHWIIGRVCQYNCLITKFNCVLQLLLHIECSISLAPYFISCLVLLVPCFNCAFHVLPSCTFHAFLCICYQYSVPDCYYVAYITLYIICKPHVVHLCNDQVTLQKV